MSSVLAPRLSWQVSRARTFLHYMLSLAVRVLLYTATSNSREATVIHKCFRDQDYLTLTDVPYTLPLSFSARLLQTESRNALQFLNMMLVMSRLMNK